MCVLIKIQHLEEAKKSFGMFTCRSLASFTQVPSPFLSITSQKGHASDTARRHPSVIQKESLPEPMPLKAL